jgi:asparagine synthase (glutamine-hydrolysing)
MSGIAGAILADRERSVPSDIAARQARAIRPRGPDGEAHWSDGHVYLCHTHRDTTGFHESNLDQADAPTAIVADIRLDNRAELARELHIDGLATASDAALVLAAYLRWGEDCCSHLCGDFAFAIWDKANQTLFCARDQMGVKPLFYANGANGFLFASELSGVVSPGGEIEETRLAGFLIGFGVEPELTAYRGANRLPSGHSLTLRDGRPAIRRYWSLADAAEPHEGPAVEIFRERFGQAVATRLRGTEALGAMLSGGLDSSSIVAVAARQLAGGPDQPLRTYSFDYKDNPHLDERQYVEAVLDAYALHPTFVSFDDLAPLRGLDQLADGQSDLLFAPGLPKMARLFAAARQVGTRVLLDGHGGDEVVSHGFGRLSELAAGGDWFGLYRELKGAAQLFGESPNRLFLRYFARYGPGRRLQRVMLRMGVGASGPPTSTALAFLDPAFAARTEAGDRHDAWQQRLRQAQASERALHAWNVSMPQVGESFEALDRAAMAAGVELRFPFYDRRVVSFVLGVPASEILQNGWTRSLLRRAMQDVLPAKVQWRRDKIDFGPEMRLGLIKHHAGILADLTRGDSPIAAYVDTIRLRAAIDRLIAQPMALEAGELFIIWRCVFLSLWLRSRHAAQ